jgi:hypothetical protein
MGAWAAQLRLAAVPLFFGITVSFQRVNFPLTPYPCSSQSRKWNDVLTRIPVDSFPSRYQCLSYVSSISLSASSSQSTQEFSSSQSSLPLSSSLNEKQLDFTCGYLNKHHTDLLAAIAESLSPLGEIKSKRNSWSGGSYNIELAKLMDINTQFLTLEVKVQERNKDVQVERVAVNLGMEWLSGSLKINSSGIVFLILILVVWSCRCSTRHQSSKLRKQRQQQRQVLATNS